MRIVAVDIGGTMIQVRSLERRDIRGAQVRQRRAHRKAERH